MRSLDEATVELLRQRAAEETDAAVKYEIETGLALAALDGSDRDARLAAIETLARAASAPTCATGWRRSSSTRADGTFVEPDAEVRRAAADAPSRSIDTSRSLYAGIETLFFGLSLGSVLVLVAIGLAITFGVMGVINMAHGELMMLGAYTTYVVQMLMPGASSARRLLVAIPAAFLVAGTGRRAPRADRSSAFSTAGRSRRCSRRSASAWCCSSSSARSSRPTTARSRRRAWMSGTLQINEALSLTFNRLYIVAFTLDRVRAAAAGAASARGSGSRSAPCRRTGRWRAPSASAATGSTR